MNKAKIKTLGEKLLAFYIKIPYCFLNWLYNHSRSKHDSLDDFLLVQTLKLYEEKKDLYFNYVVVPKYADQFVDINNYSNNLPRYSVVIQGPIVLKDHFTFETAKLYKKIFPQADIVLSTWEGEDIDEIKQIRELGVTVIESSKPLRCGSFNVNYQFKSSYEGIKYAKQKGCSYVFKTRSDQRIYRNNVYEELFLLLQQNPIANGKQNKRIVALGGRSGQIFWPLHASDFFYFGDIDDMLNFFDMEEHEGTKRNPDIYGTSWEGATRRKKCEEDLHAEPLIYKRYFKKLGYDIDYSVKQSWDIFGELFIFISENDLNLYWLDKYNSRYEVNRRNGLYRQDDREYKAHGYNFDYFKWNILVNQLFPYKDYFECYKELDCDGGHGLINTSEKNEIYFEQQKMKYLDKMK